MRSITSGLVQPGGGSSGGGGAPDDAQYLVAAANGDLTAERVTTDTATVTWDHGVAGQAKANVPDGGITYAKIQDVSATDKVLGRSTAGAGDVEEIACTAAGRALLDDADAAAQRTTLGLVIGTNVQAQDAELAALAGLTSAADKLPYFTGSGTAGLADFTAAGRALVDDADAAAQRTTLGVAPVSTVVTFGNGLGAGYAPVDNTNHYMAFCANPGTAAAAAANAVNSVNQKRAGTITEVYFAILVGGVNGSNETGSLMIRVNNTTDNTIVNNTVVWNTGVTLTEYNTTGLSIALAAGDFWQVKIDPPTWTTNPTAVFYFCQVTVTYP